MLIGHSRIYSSGIFKMLMLKASVILLLLIATLHSTRAQNTSACSAPDIPLMSVEHYTKIARSVVMSYLAGEDYVGIQSGETSRKVLTEENLSFIQSVAKFLDPKQFKESVYHRTLETGEVPDGPLTEIGIEKIVENYAFSYLEKLKGPSKLVLNVMRDHPELKYNQKKFGQVLFEAAKNFRDDEFVATDDTPDEDPLKLCRADLDFLYNPLLETIACLIREVINDILGGVLEDCDFCVRIPLIGERCLTEILGVPSLCLNITAPSRPSPEVTGTFIDAQFKIPPGLTQGNLHWVGSFDQCNRIEDTIYNTSLVGMVPGEMHTLKARYCRVGAWPPSLIGNDSFPTIHLSFGVCVPNSCAAPEAIENITADFEVIGLRVFEMFCGFDDLKLSDDPSSEAAVVIIIIIAIIVILATIYDMLIRKPLLATRIKQVVPYLKGGSKGGSPMPSTPIVDALPGSGPPLPVSFSVGGDEKDAHSVTNGGYPVISKPIYDKQLSYTELDNDDYRRYSLNSDKDNYASISRAPSYISQVSAMSTSDLLNNELGAKRESIIVPNALDEPPTCLDRLEGTFVAFSAYSNAKRIFTLDDAAERLISCDSVKFVSLIWSVYGYTWVLGTLYSESWTTSNLLPAVVENVPTFLFQIVINFPFSADATFVVAGCLMTYHWMKRFEKEKKVTWQMVVYHYAHRYVRLMIPLMLVLMFYSCLYKLVVAGPLVPPRIKDADTCRNQWFINLFLLHNLISDGLLCLTWSFNVAVLFQFHLIAPFILVPLVLKPVAGYGMFGLTFLAHLIALGIFSGEMVDSGGSGTWFNDILMTPWCRAGPILVGMAVGYALFIYKQKTFTIPYWGRLIAWICTIGCLMAPIFSTYDVLRVGGSMWNRAQSINYQLWSRTAFGLGVGWLIFSAETGFGGFPGRFLRYKEWIPFSRLSYLGMLLSPMFTFQNVYSQMAPITITSQVMLYFFFGNMTMTLLVATALSLLMQWPFAEVENAVFSKTKWQLIKMGRNPLNDMKKSQTISLPPTLRHSLSSAQEINRAPSVGSMLSGGLTPPGGLMSPSGFTPPGGFTHPDSMSTKSEHPTEEYFTHASVATQRKNRGTTTF